MDAVLENQLLTSICKYEMRVVPEKTNFWMIRTQKGYFYSEFVKKGYIALGWNIIDKTTNLGKQGLEELKFLLQKEYGEKIPGNAINKCKNFIEAMQPGDVVIIPDRGAKTITFAIVGEYYELADKSLELEKEIIPKIRANELVGGNVVCPYKKRRKISVIRTVHSRIINPHLMDGITSYHGLSKMNDYAKCILDSMYDAYLFKNISSLQFDVNTMERINAVSLSKMIYALTDYISAFLGEEQLGITLNLNSPGKISISEESENIVEQVGAENNKKLKDTFKKLGNGWAGWVAILLAVTLGAEIGPVKAPGIVGLIREIRTMKYDVEERKNDIEIQDLEIERMKLENLQMKEELLISLDENGVDIDRICKDLELLLEIRDELEVGTHMLDFEQEAAITEEQ